MSILPRCICDPLDAMIGKYDPRCCRHLGVSRSPLAVDDDQNGMWAAVEEMRQLMTSPVASQESPDLAHNRQKDEAAEVHRILDEKHVPRTTRFGTELTLWGRINFYFGRRP